MLEVIDLDKHFSSGGMLRKKYVKVVDRISFRIGRGETFGLVGESGCGKTTAGKSTLRLIEPTSGKIVFDGIDVTKLKTKEMRKLRPRMQMIFQDPDASLDPRMKTEKSIAEPLRLRGGLSKREIERRVMDLIETVGLNPEHAHRYPYQMSGGQNQRVVLARALASNPDFIVADEPTSGLDVSVQAQILNLMNELKRDLELTTMFITHDLEVARHMSDRMAVMYRGKILEMGGSEEIFNHPRHPYARMLIDPKLQEYRDLQDAEVNGKNDDLLGCVFYPRCPFAEDVCMKKEPDMVEMNRDQCQVLCHLV
jgi:oligopeptide/dipeptide ABC transporter ATP-binding protein